MDRQNKCVKNLKRKHLLFVPALVIGLAFTLPSSVVWADANSALEGVSTTRHMDVQNSNNGKQQAGAPISTSRSNIKHGIKNGSNGKQPVGAPINTSRSNIKHGVKSGSEMNQH